MKPLEGETLENATITSLDCDLERGALSMWLRLEYESGGQGFGGFMLYLPEDWKHHGGPNYCGHFLWRVLEVAGVDDFSKLPGKVIRVVHTWTDVRAVGHATKAVWFEPKVEFERLGKAYKAFREWLVNGGYKNDTFTEEAKS